MPCWTVTGGLAAWLSACLLACLSGILVAWLPGCAAWLPGCLGQAGRAKVAQKTRSKNLEIVKKMGTENL